MSIEHGKTKEFTQVIDDTITLAETEEINIPRIVFESGYGISCDGNLMALISSDTESYLGITNGVLLLHFDSIKHKDITLYTNNINSNGNNELLLYSLYFTESQLYYYKFNIFGKYSNDFFVLDRTFAVYKQDGQYKIGTIQANYTYRDDPQNNIELQLIIEDNTFKVKLINIPIGSNYNIKYSYITSFIVF